MAATNLTFTKVNNEWVSTFTSQGACVIQLERNEKSPVSVSANLEGMKPVVVASFSNPYVASVIFSLDIMDGIEVTIKSATEVLVGKITYGEENGGGNMEKWETVYSREGELSKTFEGYYGFSPIQYEQELIKVGDTIMLVYDGKEIGIGNTYALSPNEAWVNVNPSEYSSPSPYVGDWSVVVMSGGRVIKPNIKMNTQPQGTHKIELKKKIS